MKKLIFTLSLFALVVLKSSAQWTDVNSYCGGSGSGVCQIPNLSSPGLSPISDSLLPVIDGVESVVTINFKNYNIDTVSGVAVTIDSIQIDSITNLPTGFCWKTSDPNNGWPNQGNGCITVSGTTNAAPGQYALGIYVNVYTQQLGNFSSYASAFGLYYYVRVNCSDSAVVRPIDTTGQAEGTLSPFVAYTENSCDVAVKTIDGNIQSLNVYPNPFNNLALVSFSSIKAGVMTEKITNIIGSTVYSKQLDVAVGKNTHTLNRNGLAAGVYFYTISDGTSSFTQKLIVTE